MEKHQTTEKDGNGSIVRITCSSPSAREIMLTGSFNDWNTAELPMSKGADGQWSINLKLPQGRLSTNSLSMVSCVASPI